MKKKSLLKIWLKLLILSFALVLSFINFKGIIDQSINENGNLSFIQQTPEQNYLFKKFVYISGGVNNPGVYEITKDDLRLVELIQEAGGLSENVDKDKMNQSFNLSSIVKDSDHIFIPIKSISPNNNSSNSDLININSASLSELDSLPGIGPSTAQKIIDARPFTSIEELQDVSGIGDAKYEDIKDLVTVN